MEAHESECLEYLAQQNFSEKEIENLHAGKPEYKEVGAEE